MAIEKRGKVWYSNFQVNGRRYHERLSTNEAVAWRMERELKAMTKARAEGRVVEDAGWDSFKKEYLSWSAIKGHTTRRLEAAAIAYLEDFHHITKVADITPRLLDNFRAHLKQKGKGIYIINRHVRGIKTIMRWAESKSFVPRQDWSSVGKFKEPQGRLDFLTIEELERLLKAASIHTEHLTLALLCSRAGLRAAEAYHLEWRDVDLERNRINIVAKEGFTPKDYERRYIPMPQDLAGHLKKIKPKSRSRYVIADASGWRPSSPASMATEFKRTTMTRAGLGNRGRLHILRHTYASHLASNGATQKLLKELLGHQSLETTEVYTHLMPAYIDSAANLAPKIQIPA